MADEHPTLPDLQDLPGRLARPRREYPGPSYQSAVTYECLLADACWPAKTKPESRLWQKPSAGGALAPLAAKLSESAQYNKKLGQVSQRLDAQQAIVTELRGVSLRLETELERVAALSLVTVRDSRRDISNETRSLRDENRTMRACLKDVEARLCVVEAMDRERRHRSWWGRLMWLVTGR